MRPSPGASGPSALRRLSVLHVTFRASSLERQARLGRGGQKLMWAKVWASEVEGSSPHFAFTSCKLWDPGQIIVLCFTFGMVISPSKGGVDPMSECAENSMGLGILARRRAS